MEVKGLCKDCVYRKHMSQPYDGEHEVEQYSNDYVYANLWGPASTASLSGAQYIMLLLNECTSKLTGYFFS